MTEHPAEKYLDGPVDISIESLRGSLFDGVRDSPGAKRALDRVLKEGRKDD